MPTCLPLLRGFYLLPIDFESSCCADGISLRELHGDTLAALQEFYSERLSREERFQDLKNDVERKSSQAQWSMDTFSEDWNASQFWVLCN